MRFNAEGPAGLIDCKAPDPTPLLTAEHRQALQNHDDIVAHCCHHWNRLPDQPWRIMSIGMRDWAHRF